jgi:hypothetical protein
MAKKIIFGLILSLFICSIANAEVVLKIRAVNPLDTEAVTPVRAYLPKPAGPEDILSSCVVRPASGEKTQYDIRNTQYEFDEEKEQYYVEQELVLAPKEVVVLEVEVKDVWVIEEERIERIADSVERIVESEKRKVKSEKLFTERYPLVAELKEEILKNLDRIIRRQAENTVALVGVERHIKTYEENMAALEQVEMDLQMLQGLIGK